MDFLSLKVEGHAGIVTMDKPPMNTFNLQMYQELQETFEAINDNDRIWMAIFRAEGKNFSTGNDVSEFTMLTSPEKGLSYSKKVSDSVGSVYACRVPVIGVINGMALGTGLALASCCDILIAAEDARFGLPEGRVGIVGAACFISRMLPQQLHRYMAYSGDMMTAEEMKSFGAVLKVVPGEQLLASAMGVAERLLKNPPLVLKGFKAAINTNENAILKEKYAVEMSYTVPLLKTADFKEAVTSFLEKRKPAFRGQ